MKVLENIVNWFEADSFLPFVDANNGVTIFLICVVVGIVAVCCSKKLRKIFF